MLCTPMAFETLAVSRTMAATSYTPGPEEFYNGANESGDGLADNPCQSLSR